MIVLDTHALLWWVSGSKELSRGARERIEEAMGANAIHVSSISAWEVAQLVRKGRLELTLDVDDWIARCEALPFLRFEAVDNRIALRSVALPGPLHDDPVDRIIVATALVLKAPLATREQRLHDYPHVETVW